jgi:hypothetical protein
MIELFDVFLLMLFAAVCAWLWRGHGIRERALLLAKQHCAKLDIELLNGLWPCAAWPCNETLKAGGDWYGCMISSSPSPARSACAVKSA